MSLSSILAACAMFAVLVSSIVLRNTFEKVVKAIPALDSSIQTKMGNGFMALYAVSAIGGVILVFCLSIVAEDAR